MTKALLALAILLALSAVPASAQTYPSRPIHIIVPFAAGGSADIQTRTFAEAFGAAMKQPVVIENRAGASGNIGTEAAARSAPDGYTLVIGGPNIINNAYLFKAVPYDRKRDLTPLGLMFANPNVLIVNEAFPATTVQEFISVLKANPNKYAFGSAGAGGSIHLSALLFMSMTGTQMLHVPYRGDALAQADLLGGAIQVMFNALSSSLENIRAQKWRALATTGAARSTQLPDLPTVQESGLDGYVVTSWQGLYGPANLPADVVAKIRAGFEAVYADAKALKRFQEIGTVASPSTPDEHAAFMDAQERIWSPVFKAANLTPQ